MPTIRDVAARAEVSTATVSHVLNNTRFVSAETREAVLHAIRDLNYHPSAIAQSLTTHKTHTVGMVISDITNNFFGQMVRGALDTITPFDYTLLLCTTEESLIREEEYLQLLFKGKVDGFIAAATSQKWGMLQIVEAFHIPIVFVDRVFEGMRGPHVGVDNEFGAFQAVSHLIEDGHRRIGIVVGPAQMSTMEDRLAGYRQAMEAHGLPVDDSLIGFCALSSASGRCCAQELLNRADPPTALFTNNNFLTLGALLAFQDLGRRCPEDVALIGFDDHPWAPVTSPPLTSVRQPDYEIGRRAADLLLRMLAGEPVGDERVLLRPELIVRASCRVGPHEVIGI